MPRAKAVWCGALIAAVVLHAPVHAQTIDPRIEKLVGSISEARLQQLLQKLVSFKTRNTCSDPAAPDGIGTVLSMELARVFAESGIEFDATLVFMTVAGEEQGLVGAGAHAKTAKDEKIPIQAWFNNDIVGGSRGGDGIIDGATIRLYSEGPEDSPSRSLAMFAARIGARYVPSHRVRLMVDGAGHESTVSAYVTAPATGGG